MKTFEKHFRQDIAIYEHFNKTFWQKVENFGHDRMKLEKRKIEDVFKKCNLDPDFCNFEITPNKKLASTERVTIGTKNELVRAMEEAKGFCSDGIIQRLKLDLDTGCPLIDETYNL